MTPNLWRIAFIGLLITIFISCTKYTPDAPEEPQMLVRKFTIIYPSSSGAGNDSVSMRYEYTSDGKVVKYYTNGSSNPSRIHTYNDNHLAAITFKIPSDDTLINGSYYSINGDTVRLQRIRDKTVIFGGIDTIFYTYIFQNDRLIEESYYEHVPYIQPEILNWKKRYFSYNTDGNLLTIEEESKTIARRVYATVLSWDDKKNPFCKQAREDFYLNRYAGELQSSSVHNPTRVRYYTGIEYNVVMTYNADGYPSSVIHESQPNIKMMYEYMNR